MHLYFSLYGQQLCVSAQAFTIHVKVARFQIRRLSRRHLSFPPSKSVGIFFMVPCISFYNLIQCSRRIVHIRHHAANIDGVFPGSAVVGDICLYLTPGVCSHGTYTGTYRLPSVLLTRRLPYNTISWPPASECLSFKNLSSVSLPINIGSPSFKPNLDLPNRDLIIV